MAAKYQLITELYRRTGVAVAKNPQAWQGFLSSACRNYKCRFDEQLLIYAQRPAAVAVAKLETWNRQFKRWVNKDSKGIAVFDPKGRRNTLKYYFDVSDTHEGYYGSRPVPIWQMDERYEQAVMERLSDRFGDVESTDLASALMETAKNAVEDNLQDYFSQLKDCTKDSFLEELDDFNIEVIYRRLAANSVAFMLISRCGLDTNEFLTVMICGYCKFQYPCNDKRHRRCHERYCGNGVTGNLTVYPKCANGGKRPESHLCTKNAGSV